MFKQAVLVSFLASVLASFGVKACLSSSETEDLSSQNGEASQVGKPDVKGSQKGDERQASAKNEGSDVSSAKEDVIANDGKPHGTGGNPKARQIREALSTPQHTLLAKTSPAWTQTRKVLMAHSQDVWAEKLSELLEEISTARRDPNLEGNFLLGRQNALLESLWNADFSPDLKQALKEPLSVLGERIEAYGN